MGARPRLLFSGGVASDGGGRDGRKAPRAAPGACLVQGPREHLHQVRILGKRLRYAMEVFADCFALAFREKLYPLVEQMQEVLGNANDSHVAGRRLEALSARLQALVPAQWKRLRPGLEGLQQ